MLPYTRYATPLPQRHLVEITVTPLGRRSRVFRNRANGGPLLDRQVEPQPAFSIPIIPPLLSQPSPVYLLCSKEGYIPSPEPPPPSPVQLPFEDVWDEDLIKSPPSPVQLPFEDNWDESVIESPPRCSPAVDAPLVLISLQRISDIDKEDLKERKDYNLVDLYKTPHVNEGGILGRNFDGILLMGNVKLTWRSFGEFTPDNISDPYRDYMKELKKMEGRRVPYHGRSPQIGRRMSTMKFISNACRGEEYCMETLTHAIYLYDRFSDGNDIAEDQVCVVALVCVVIAAKLAENDSRSPTPKEVHRRYIKRGTNMSFKLFLSLEMNVLKFFDYHILSPTEVHFVDCFLLFGLDGYGTDIFKELYKFQHKKSYTGNQSDILLELYDCTSRLCKIMAIMMPSPAHQSSLTAAGILMFARRECNLNFWTQKLVAVTGYEFVVVLNLLKTVVEPCVRDYCDLGLLGPFPNHPRREPIFVNFFNFNNNAVISI